VATTRLDGQGAMARPTTIAQVAELPWYRGVRRGPDLVVARFGFPASLYVARVQP